MRDLSETNKPGHRLPCQTPIKNLERRSGLSRKIRVKGRAIVVDRSCVKEGGGKDETPIAHKAMERRMTLAGKTAIVRGIGCGCALQLARNGAHVAVWDVQAEGSEETVRLIEAEGHSATPYVGDASNPAEISRILAQIRAKLGPVQILVNNATLVPFRTFLDINVTDLADVCRVNLMGPAGIPSWKSCPIA